MNEILRSALHVISENLGNPAMIILLIALAFSVFVIGEAVGEYFVKRFKKNLDIHSLLVELDRVKSPELCKSIIARYHMRFVQSEAIDKVLSLPEGISDEARRTVAVQAVIEAEQRSDRALLPTKIIARIGPMLGLLGTLIPLGPGLSALGEGDPKALSDAMLMAFDTTIAGLLSGLIAFVVYEIKKSWHAKDLSAIETILEEVTSE